MDTTLINLPWQVQLSLASGYAAYLIANVGNRAHHQTVDVAFSTLLFGLCATAIYNVIFWIDRDSFAVAMVSAVVAFVMTILLGGAWRKWGRPLVRGLLRKFHVSFSDDDLSVLSTLSADVNHLMTSIAVRIDDGRWLRCDDTSLFWNKPFGPCVLAQDGGVALYVTHVKNGDETRVLDTTIDAEFGDRLTYIPASRVTQVNLRYIKKSTTDDQSSLDGGG